MNMRLEGTDPSNPPNKGLVTVMTDGEIKKFETDRGIVVEPPRTEITNKLIDEIFEYIKSRSDKECTPSDKEYTHFFPFANSGGITSGSTLFVCCVNRIIYMLLCRDDGRWQSNDPGTTSGRYFYLNDVKSDSELKELIKSKLEVILKQDRSLLAARAADRQAFNTLIAKGLINEL